MEKDTYNDTFYMVLSNTDSISYYPNNKPSKFTVQFDKNIDLLRKMEVALVETIFSKLNTTVKLIIHEMPLNFKHDIRFDLTLFEIKNVLSLYDILRENLNKISENMVINKIVKLFTGKDSSRIYTKFELIEIILPEFWFDYDSKLFNMRSGEIKAKVYSPYPGQWHDIHWYLYYEFDEKLNSIIQFPSFETNYELYESRNKLDISIINHLYMYLNILTPSIIGSSKSNLLRVISRSNDLKESNTVKLNNKIFIPVNRQLIESIKVTIKDEKGNLINFIGDKIILVLLFRSLEHI